MIRQTLLILRKELQVEWRQRSRASGVLFFALALVLIIAFASPSEAALRAQAGGSLWVGVLLASTRALDQSFGVELENGTLEGQMLWPVDGRAIYYGKAIANTLLLFCVAVAMTPLIIAVYDAPVAGPIDMGVGFLLFGSAAIAAPAAALR